MSDLSTTEEIEVLFDELFPLPRSITGDGYRKSVKILSQFIPFQIERVASGSKIFDWTVPKEWVIKNAYLIDPNGNKILDFKNNNLAIVNYSSPVDEYIELEDLDKNLHSIPQHPDFTPYVTSYYAEYWGFCLPHRVRQALKPGKYHAKIESSFIEGFVEYGYAYLKGNSDQNDCDRKLILLSSYLCHPSLANNELSGPIVLAALYERISRWENRSFDYLFVINPETIGSICFLHKHGNKIKKSLQAGMVLTCLGGPKEKLLYKKSRRDNSSLDELCMCLAQDGEIDVKNFDPAEGSDERQYCSPGFNLPVGNISKTTYNSGEDTHPEYHTSGDNKEFVRLNQFLETISKVEWILKVHECLKPLKRLEPHCEIQLGKRGLYPNLNSPTNRNLSSDSLPDGREQLRAIRYILNYSDGEHTLVDIAKLSKIKIRTLMLCLEILIKEDSVLL